VPATSCSNPAHGRRSATGTRARTTNGHHQINESNADCSFVVISGGARTGGAYSDIDMVFTADSYLHKDGTPYEARPAS